MKKLYTINLIHGLIKNAEFFGFKQCCLCDTKESV